MPETAQSHGVLAELRRHAVALISLAVALSGLGYNTWRNETTEAHRNTRQAAFVMLQQLGELQQIVDRRYYAGQHDEATRIDGWGRVVMLRDLGGLVSPATHVRSTQLFEAWQQRNDALDAADRAAEREISAAIGDVREQVLADLLALQ